MALSNGTLKIGTPPETIVDVTTTFTEGTLLATIVVNGVATPIYWKDETPQETTGGVWNVVWTRESKSFTLKSNSGQWKHSDSSTGSEFVLSKDRDRNRWKLSGGWVLGWVYTAYVTTENFSEKSLTFTAKDNIDKTQTFVLTWAES